MKHEEQVAAGIPPFLQYDQANVEQFERVTSHQVWAYIRKHGV